MTKSAANEIERMVVTRVFDAPRELVWKAWTEPQYVKQWWGPKGFTAPFCEMDFRVGGKFLYCMRAPDGQEFWNGGEYHEIVPHEKIVSSMYFSDAKGNRVEPAQYGIEHEAIDGAHDMILFEDLGGTNSIYVPLASQNWTINMSASLQGGSNYIPGGAGGPNGGTQVAQSLSDYPYWVGQSQTNQTCP